MQLVAVQGAMTLDAPAANAWAAMDAACRKATGVDLTITSPAGAYRSPAMVLDMWLSSPARRLALYGVPLGTSVARPKSLGGNGSIHENGRCVDISNWGYAAVWLRANASKFGFRRTIATEPWHFQHDGITAAGGGGSGAIPIPDPPEELVMRETQWYQMVDSSGADVADWSRVGADVLPTGNFPGGYEATADVNVARLWGRQIQGPDYRPVKLPRTDYIAVQQWGHREYLAHRADDIARVAEGSDDSSVAGPTAAQIASLVKVPTAAEIAALVQFPTTLTIDPPPATGTLT